MTVHLTRDLEHLKREILTMGSLVEEAMRDAIRALLERNLDLAHKVIEGDDTIDRREVEVEEVCLKVLALNQPMAADLRFIITVLKVNDDLERIADMAVNLAERAAYLADHPPLTIPADLGRMAENVQTMLRMCLDALVRSDADLAREVLRHDDEVDDANRRMFVVLQELMSADPSTIKRAMHTLSSSRYLERTADLATNIAEDVVFMVEGEIIRHRGEALPR